jgi:hypothetical protein
MHLRNALCATRAKRFQNIHNIDYVLIKNKELHNSRLKTIVKRWGWGIKKPADLPALQMKFCAFTCLDLFFSKSVTYAAMIAVEEP